MDVSGKLEALKMTQLLQDIFSMEDSEKFDEAFEAYNALYNRDKNDYDVWKHFYFFLWTAIEDAPNSFHDKVNLQHLLQIMLEEGKKSFADKADFNFIAGYTVSIFPYEYGDYEDLKEEGQKMLYKATQLEPKNSIYRMVYLGSLEGGDKELYKKAEIDAAPKVIETFSGQGALNRYFREILYRLDKKAYR